MKYKTALMTACAFLLISAPALAADGPSDAAMKAITSSYALQCTALLDPSAQNADAWLGAIAPDYTNLTLTGKKITKDEIGVLPKGSVNPFQTTACDITNETPTAPDANTVVFVITLRTHAIQWWADNSKHDVDVTQKREDTWKLTNGSWILSSSKQLRALLKFDGTVQEDEGQ